MRALVLENGVLGLREEWPEPSPMSGEVVVDVRLTGVCATDLALARGYMGFAGVPGHEFVGMARTGRFAGRRVVGEINAGCGRCASCLRADPRHCTDRTVLGIVGRAGAFAERLALPERNLLAVPDALPDRAAVLTEPLAAAIAIAERLGGAVPDEVLVVGDGRLGLLCALALADAGAEVHVLGRHPERQALLERAHLDRGSVRHLGRPLVAGESPRRRYPLVVEASGRSELLAAAASWALPLGTLVLKTTSEGTVAIDTAPWVVDEIAIVGSRCGRFEPALAALERGLVPWDSFVEASFPLREGERAFERARSGGVLKVVVDIMAT